MLSGKRSLRSSKSGAKNLVAIFLVAVLLVSSLGAFLFITGDTSASGAEVKIGSTVKVDYIGRLPNGDVFDTSFLSVAKDNSSKYTKSLLFEFRGASLYTPFSLTVGQGNAITGFEYGILGMKEGEKRTLTIPYSQGYGAVNESKLKNFTLVETIPIQNKITKAEFKEIFGEDPKSLSTIKDPRYGWDVYVYSSDDTDGVGFYYKVSEEPTHGVYKAYASESDPSAGWLINTTISGTNIVVEHQLTADSVKTVKGYNGADGSKFIVYDVSNGVVTINTDSRAELVGVTLTFEVTIVKIS